MGKSYANKDEKARMETFEKFRSPKHELSYQELDEYFASLEPMNLDEMIGEWQGGNLFTKSWLGRLFFKDFIAMKWFGKRILSPDKVKAQVWSFLGKKLSIPIGSAILRRLEFRDKISTSLIYNYLPIIDHFRKIDDRTVMGIMEIKGKVYIYFYLKKY
jgi:hypothetical protein